MGYKIVMKFLVLIFLLLSCGKVESTPVDIDLGPVENRIEELAQRAADLVDGNGWLVSKSCDARLWTAKACLDSTDFSAAMIGEQYFRTPSKTCYSNFLVWKKLKVKRDAELDKELKAEITAKMKAIKHKSQSTTSRDMELGTLSCLVERRDLTAIEDHIEYGSDNAWIMGEGLITRTPYSLALIGLWYKVARVLGHDYGYTEVGNIYPKGQIDYQAHLSMLDIYNRFRMDGKISKIMLARINEHADREPECGFYQSMKSKFSGDLQPAIDICLGESKCSYVRCDEELEKCRLAEQIFSCRIILE